MIEKQLFYKKIKEKDNFNINRDISFYLPTKDKKYELYFYLTNRMNNKKIYAEYRIYKRSSRIYVQDTKEIPLEKEKIYTDFKLYKYLKKEINNFYELSGKIG